MNFIKSAVKFLPVIVLAGLMISGQDALIAAPIAAIAAVIVARITEKLTFKDRKRDQVRTGPACHEGTCFRLPGTGRN